ncbi:MAG: MFS transporter, partial [Pseudobdellovibrio sp.]
MSEETNEKKALNPLVIKLGIVSFFADVASEMLYPITPIFLTAVLGSSMASLGLIEGVAEALASLLKTYSGSWSDKISKRKPFVIAGYFLAAIAKPIIGLAGNWEQVLFARALDRTGKGLRTAPRDAMLADSVDESQRGAAFGWHRAMDTAGAALGPLFAITLLSANAENLRPLYYWALIPGLCSVIVLFSLKEPKAHTENKKWQNPLAAWSNFSPEFKKYVLAWGVFSIANSSDAFLLMKVKSAGASTVTIILMYCAYNLVYALLSPYLGGLSDRMRRKNILMAGLAVFTFVYTGFSFADSSWQYWALFMIYGAYMAATDGVGKALAVDLVPSNLKATGVGMLNSVAGVCTLFASIVAGLLWDHVSAPATFIYGA